jgi:hypothetical protein
LNGDRYQGVAVARLFALTLRNDKGKRNPQGLSKKHAEPIATDQSLVATLERRRQRGVALLRPLVYGELRRMERSYMRSTLRVRKKTKPMYSLDTVRPLIDSIDS